MNQGVAGSLVQERGPNCSRVTARAAFVGAVHRRSGRRRKSSSSIDHPTRGKEECQSEGAIERSAGGDGAGQGEEAAGSSARLRYAFEVCVWH